MDRLQDWLFACVLTLCILLVLACQSESATSTCKDGVCSGFTEGVIHYPLSNDQERAALNYMAKVLSEQRKYGPEITAQDVLDLLGEALRRGRRKSET